MWKIFAFLVFIVVSFSERWRDNGEGRTLKRTTYSHRVTAQYGDDTDRHGHWTFDKPDHTIGWFFKDGFRWDQTKHTLHLHEFKTFDQQGRIVQPLKRYLGTATPSGGGRRRTEEGEILKDHLTEGERDAGKRKY